MKPFKVGDRIRCIDSDTSPLELWNVYTVTGLYIEYPHEYVELEETRGSRWNTYRFKLVRSTTKQPVTLDDELFTL